MRTNLWSYVGKVISIFPKQSHRFNSTLKRNNTYFSSWHLSSLSKECIYWKNIGIIFSGFLTCLLLFLQSGYGNIGLFHHQPVSHDGSGLLVIFKLYISKRLTTRKQGCDVYPVMHWFDGDPCSDVTYPCTSLGPAWVSSQSVFQWELFVCDWCVNPGDSSFLLKMILARRSIFMSINQVFWEIL